MVVFKIIFFLSFRKIGSTRPNKNFSKLNAKELIFSNDKETIKKTIKTDEQIPNKTNDPVNKRRDKVKDVI